MRHRRKSALPLGKKKKTVARILERAKNWHAFISLSRLEPALDTARLHASAKNKVQLQKSLRTCGWWPDPPSAVPSIGRGAIAHRALFRLWRLCHPSRTDLDPLVELALAIKGLKIYLGTSPSVPVPTGAPLGAPTPNDFEKTGPMPPSHWAGVFNCDVKTLKARIRDGSIRAKKLSPKSYQLAIDDLPAKEQTKHRSQQG
jgi:hypothetical protein